MCTKSKVDKKPSPIKEFRFLKSSRLLKPYDFQHVFDAVDCKQGGRFFTFLSRSNTLNNTRLGLVISKRQLNHAVSRNRVKRAIRESFRKQLLMCNTFDVQFDIIVLTKPAVKKIDNATLNQELEKQWQKLLAKRKVLSSS